MTNRLEHLIAANEALKAEIAKRIVDTARSECDALISEENPNPVMRVTSDGAVLYANQSASVLLAHWHINIGDRLPDEWRVIVVEAANGKQADEHELRCAGKIFSLTVLAVVDADYVNIYGRDITSFKETEDQIVNFDDLTGLPNRALFQDRLHQVLSYARRSGKLAAVHLINLDRFKEINETLGRNIGDALLQGIASRLLNCIRTSDTVARLGGDEFGIIQVEPNDNDGVAILAQKLLSSLKQPFEIDGHTIYSAASIGITVFPDDAQSPDDVLRNADLALSYGKSNDRGNYRFFVAQMHDDIQRRRSIEEDMRGGLERGEFVLHYQPKLHIGSNRITGMEALIRWNHPEQGFMSPAEFIPVAERSKLIVPMGEWVLREACTRNKAWTDAGLGPVKVAVNLSAVQFHQDGLVEMIKHTLDDTGLDPTQLELEITESLAMRDAEASIELCTRLSEFGVSLSIDDFGTGYSSLSYLKNFPVQRIKIDKAFVDDIDGKDDSGGIARAVTTLGHSFGMEITAEGVETEEQLVFLDSLGCDEIQGYYFSRPLPDAEFEEFLKNFENTWALRLSQERRQGIDRRNWLKAQSTS
ncbi:MAG: EAL domain-containing protein [Proteobacteria bacterium]|nr:EAL domain-containing protein [Pseudomonadota bacterium]